MSILMFIVITLILVALLIYAVGLIPMDIWLSRIIQAAIVLMAALVIAQQAGVV